MMAKMFYTLDETKSALGRNEEEVKQLAREGRLREFRDGPRLMFKADQVDQLKAELGGGSAPTPDLGSSDSGAALSMADSAGPSGTGVISLADTDFGKSPGAAMMKEDTALASDLGLSGSVSGIPSPGRAGGTGSGLSGSSAGSRGGITVFDVDDAHKADPSAQTAIGSGIQDQVQLDSVGSGSGLLDLTRESDDTSLGAELLDEIAPSGGGGGRAPRGTVGETALGMDPMDAPRGAINRGGFGPPQETERPDPMQGAFGGLALAGALAVLFGAFILANALFGIQPDFVTKMSGKAADNKGIIYFLAAIVGSVILFGIGWITGKGSSPSRR